MSWIFYFISTVLIVNVLSAPVPIKNASIKDPLLQPDTARKFADIFYYSLEVCGAYSSHEAKELKDSILELSDALGEFPQIQNADRILLQATAATIANSVLDKEAGNDGDASARASCVMEALRTAFRLTSGTSDTYLVSEVEKLIEVFAFKNDVPLYASFRSSAESSLGNYYYESYDSSDYYYEEDYYDSYDSSYYYEGDYYDSYDSSDYYEGDYYDDYDSSDYINDYDDLIEYLEEEYYEEYYGYPETFYEETPLLIEPYLENGFLREEDIGYPFLNEEPEIFELVPVGYEIERIPVEELPIYEIREHEPRQVVYKERIPEIVFEH